jgi:hypothetical protein
MPQMHRADDMVLNGIPKQETAQTPHGDARGGFDPPNLSPASKGSARILPRGARITPSVLPISNCLRPSQETARRLSLPSTPTMAAARNSDVVRRIFRRARNIHDVAKHLRKWMKPQRRKIDFMTYPGAQRVIPQYSALSA